VLEKHFLLAKILILPLLFYNLEDCALFMTRVKWKETSKILDLPKVHPCQKPGGGNTERWGIREKWERERITKHGLNHQTKNNE
jgi:hypothetical protein